MRLTATSSRAELPWLDAMPLALVLLCALLTGLFPLWLMLLAPLVFGVPHVAADLRYLVLEPPRPLPRALLFGAGSCFAAMTSLRLWWLFGGGGAPRVELLLGALAVAIGVLCADRRAWLIPLAALLALALTWPSEAALLVGHAHNFIAVALFVAWARPGVGSGVLAVVGAVLTLVMTGLLDGALLSVAGDSAQGLRLGSLVDALAPDLPGVWGLRAVGAFAFMQAVHYALWLVAIPIARHRNPLRGWQDAMGSWLLGGFALGTFGLLAWGWIDPPGARGGYLGLVLFHGWLELTVAAFWLAARD